MFDNKLNQFDQAVNVNLTHSQTAGDAANGSVGFPNTGFLSPITDQFGTVGCNLLIVALIALAVSVVLFLLHRKFHHLNKTSIITSLAICAFGVGSLVAATSLGANAATPTTKTADGVRVVNLSLTATPEGATTTASANAMLNTDFTNGYIVYAYVDEDPMLWNYNYTEAIDVTWPANSVNDMAMNSYGIQNQDGSFDLPSIDPKKPTKIADSSAATLAGTSLPVNYALRANTELPAGGYSTLSYSIHYEVVPNVYTLTYDYGDVATAKVVSQPHDAFFTVAGDTSAENRTGYKFNGYTKSESRIEDDAHNYIQPGTQFITDYVDTTLYASWTANTYKVTFETNGGLFPSGKDRTIKDEVFDSRYKMPKTTPTRVGYTFAGWWTDDGQKVDNETVVSIAADHTIHAYWTPEEYSVTFNANGGEFGPSETIRTITETYGQAYSFPTDPELTRTGYEFLGWFTAAEGGEKLADDAIVPLLAEGTTFYAHWQAKEITVSFHAVKGHFADGFQRIDIAGVKYDTNYPIPDEIPTCEGYEFVGWFTAEQGGNQVTKDDIVATTEDVHLYAHWQACQYAVTFDANGGIFAASGTDTETIMTAYDSEYVLPVEKPAKEGYNFIGWFTTKDDSGTEVTAETLMQTARAHTIYAHWEGKEITITFDAGDGYFDIAGQPSQLDTKEKYNEPYWAPVASVKRPHHTFLGWYTAADETGELVTMGETIVQDADPHTLYAHWQVNTYTLNYNANGVQFKSETQLGEPEFTIIDDTPERTGNKFKGWATTEGGEPLTDPTFTINETTPSAPYTYTQELYAVWETATYNVTFRLEQPNAKFEDGTTEKIIPQTYGQKYILPDTPTRQYYDTVNWQLSDGTIITDATDVVITEDTIVTDVWTIYVKFYANGGYFGDNPGALTEVSISQVDDYGGLYTTPNAPIWDDHCFKGWAFHGMTDVLDMTTLTLDATHKEFDAVWETGTCPEVLTTSAAPSYPISATPHFEEDTTPATVPATVPARTSRASRAAGK